MIAFQDSPRFVVPARPLLAAAVAAVSLAGAPAGARGAAAATGATPCVVTPDKTAQPAAVAVGDEVVIRLSLAAACNAPAPEAADIVLAIDRSGSMLEQGRFSATLAAAEVFVGLMDFRTARVAVVTFSGMAWPFDPPTRLAVALTDDSATVVRGLRAIAEPPALTMWTDLTAAVRASQRVLTGPDARVEARKILILLTDGNHNAPALVSGSPEDEAAKARAAGTTIITIGLVVDAAAADLLTRMAGSPDLFVRVPTPGDLAAAYARVALSLDAAAITAVVVVDDLAPEVAYVAGSAVPAPAVATPDRLEWRVPAIGAGGWEASYRVRPLVPGAYSPNVGAVAEYTGAEGTPGQVTFPRPIIAVSASPSYTAWLPSVLDGACRRALPFDVVLAIDSSSSMEGEKLAQARAAAAKFLGLLTMPPTQAAVVAFNDEAHLAQDLTSDRMAAMTALDGLPTGVGTRIDRALDAATEELTSPRHRLGNTPVAILLTDGRQAGAPDSKAIAAAEGARRAGVTLYTVGIGPDVSRDLLVAIAGHEGRYYPAAGPADLLAIYVSIAGALPCAEVP